MRQRIVRSAGLALSLTVAEGTPAMARHGADSRGVDHLSAWFPALIDIYFAALQH